MARAGKRIDSDPLTEMLAVPAGISQLLAC